MEQTVIDLLLAYYGDDFTGSTDVLESLSLVGIETVLFVDAPTTAMLERHPGVRAVGVAGTSRAMSPEQMEAALPRSFEALRRLHPKFVHYKICSTFDSSPDIGSIGRAIDIGQRIFQNRFVPLVAAAPALQRFCIFGNLFARSGLDSPVYRLDRHPSMRNHPITPMDEADLRVHLSRQTTRPMGLVDVITLSNGRDCAAERLRTLVQNEGTVVLFDALTSAHMATIGALLCAEQSQENKSMFVVGSSGIEHALGEHWIATQQAHAASRDHRLDASSANPVDRILVVSGSCSPVTGRQIAWALKNGFADVPVDTAELIHPSSFQAAVASATRQALAALESSQSVVVHTCLGPDDCRLKEAHRASGDQSATTRNIGQFLGRLLCNVVRSKCVRRVAVVGGDTSGLVARSLGIDALEFASSLEPGAPLCVARSPDNDVDGLEIVFKGGQVGYDDFFNTVCIGRLNRSHLERIP